jgi:hypothetical protein
LAGLFLRFVDSPTTINLTIDMLPIEPYPLPVGTIVLVNCHPAEIVEVYTWLELAPKPHPVTGALMERRVPLHYPMYRVLIDKATVLTWHHTQVHIPDETDELRLFADEFKVLALPMACRPAPFGECYHPQTGHQVLPLPQDSGPGRTPKPARPRPRQIRNVFNREDRIVFKDDK